MKLKINIPIIQLTWSDWESRLDGKYYEKMSNNAGPLQYVIIRQSNGKFHTMMHTGSIIVMSDEFIVDRKSHGNHPIIGEGLSSEEQAERVAQNHLQKIFKIITMQ